MKRKTIIFRLSFKTLFMMSILLSATFCTSEKKNIDCADNHLPSFCIIFLNIDKFNQLPIKITHTLNNEKTINSRDISTDRNSGWQCNKQSEQSSRIRCCYFNLERNGDYKIKIIWDSHISQYQIRVLRDDLGGCHVKTGYIRESYSPKS